MRRSLKDLEQYAVSATDGEIGRVVHFFLDDDHWAVRYLVVEAGGAFSGRRVLISPIAFRKVDWSTRQFHLALTIDEVKASPPVDADKPVSRQHERESNRYYGYPDYWSSTGVWGTPPQTVGRYIESEHHSPCAAWRFNGKVRSIPRGKRLRVEARAKALVHWSDDDWRTVHDADSTDRTLGMWYGLPTDSLIVGTEVVFTFYWPAAGRWEGTNFVVSIA